MAMTNLGGFAGRLSQDELLAAYQNAGGDPAELGAAPTVPAPAPVSQPEQSLPQPEPKQSELEPSPLPDMSVQRASGGPAKAIAQYHGEQLADSNERIGLIGEKGAIDSQTFADRSDIRGRQASQAQANIDDARGRVNDKQASEDRYAQEADRVYEEMKAHTQPPPQSTVSKVLGIVGAVASMKGSSAGLGQGASMLSSMLGSDTGRWAAEQEANSRLYQSALGRVQSDRQGEQNDLEVAQKMTALEAHEINAALEQVTEMGLSKNATAAAKELQLKFGQEVRQGLIGMEQAKAAQQAKRGASIERDTLFRRTIPELRALIDSGHGSELAHQVLAEKVKGVGGILDVEGKAIGQQKTQAEVDKLRAESGDGKGPEILPGYRATIPVEKSDIHDIHKNRQTLTDIQGDLKRLAEIRARNKGKVINDPDDKVQAKEILDGLSGKFSVLQGKGAPSKDEKEGIMENLINPTDVAVWTNPEKVYDALSKRLEGNFKAGLKGIGVVPSEEQTAQEAAQSGSSYAEGVESGYAGNAGKGTQAAAPPPAADVQMVTANGKVMPVPAAAVPAMRKHGWFIQGEEKTPDVAEMSDPEYMAYAMKQSGYME